MVGEFRLVIHDERVHMHLNWPHAGSDKHLTIKYQTSLGKFLISGTNGFRAKIKSWTDCNYAILTVMSSNIGN